jgi:hypothetical protein
LIALQKNKSFLKDYLILLLTWEIVMPYENLKPMVDEWHRVYKNDHLLKYLTKADVDKVEDFYNNTRHTGKLLKYLKKTFAA